MGYKGREQGFRNSIQREILNLPVFFVAKTEQRMDGKIRLVSFLVKLYPHVLPGKNAEFNYTFSK